MHDRVYMCYLRHPSLFFYIPSFYTPSFILFVERYFDIYTLNKHSIMITNTSDDLSLDDKTVVSYKQV